MRARLVNNPRPSALSASCWVCLAGSLALVVALVALVASAGTDGR